MTAICPVCQGSAHRSRLRWYERWRKLISTRRPFRCVSCNHRLWASASAEESRDTVPFEQFSNISTPINLPALDASLHRPRAADKT